MTAMLMTPDLNKDTNGYPDSRATNHITNDLNNITNSKEVMDGQQIHTANGAGLSITHSGPSSLITPSKHIFYLQNLLHVPSVTKNLLSVSQFTKDNKVYFEFHPNFCVIKDQATGKILLQGLLHDGLYSFKMQASSPKLMSHSNINQVFHTTTPLPSYTLPSCNSPFDIWHRQLGNPSTPITNKVLNDCIPNVHINKKLSFCTSCALGKSHCLPFTPSKTIYTAPLQLIISDLWGPTFKTSRNNYKYYITFIDLFSKYTWIYFLENKSQVFSTFIQFLSLVEKHFNIPILAFQ